MIEREFSGREHVNALRHHFVGFVATSEKLKNTHFLSGFILRFEEDWLWCSAGHCIEVIESYLEAGDAGFALQPTSEKSGLGVPINPEGAIRRSVNSGCLDFGFLVLTEFYVRSLMLAGVKPIELEEVAYTSSREMTYVLVGVPKETVGIGRRTELGAELTFMPIAVNLNRGDDHLEPDGLWSMEFGFQRDMYVINEKPLESVEGMSGSPIFVWGLDSSTGDSRYIPVGIQYAWVPQTNSIRATPMKALRNALELPRNRAGA